MAYTQNVNCTTCFFLAKAVKISQDLAHHLKWQRHSAVHKYSVMTENTVVSPRNYLKSSSELKHYKSIISNLMPFTTITTTTTITSTILQLSGFCPGQPEWDGTRRNIYPFTPIVVINHPLSASSIYYNPRHPPCSIYMPNSLFPRSLSKFCLVYLMAWHTPLHTPYISSHSDCLLVATHAHTIATCSAVVPRLCHLILVSLSTLYLELLSFSLMPHIHLTILISAHWSATSFSFLMGQDSPPCSILLRTQLLYNLTVAINDTSLLVSYGTNCHLSIYTFEICRTFE